MSTTPEQQKRCYTASVSLSFHEFNKLKAESDRQGITVSGLIREAIIWCLSTIETQQTEKFLETKWHVPTSTSND